MNLHRVLPGLLPSPRRDCSSRVFSRGSKVHAASLIWLMFSFLAAPEMAAQNLREGSDQFSEATRVGDSWVTLDGYLSGATAEPLEPLPSGMESLPEDYYQDSVWWEFVAPESDTYSFSVTGPFFLSVFRGTTLEDLELIEENGDPSVEARSLSVSLDAGEAVFVRLSSNESTAGQWFSSEYRIWVTGGIFAGAVADVLGLSGFYGSGVDVDEVEILPAGGGYGVSAGFDFFENNWPDFQDLVITKLEVQAAGPDQYDPYYGWDFDESEIVHGIVGFPTDWNGAEAFVFDPVPAMLWDQLGSWATFRSLVDDPRRLPQILNLRHLLSLKGLLGRFAAPDSASEVTPTRLRFWYLPEVSGDYRFVFQRGADYGLFVSETGFGADMTLAGGVVEAMASGDRSFSDPVAMVAGEPLAVEIWVVERGEAVGPGAGFHIGLEVPDAEGAFFRDVRDSRMLLPNGRGELPPIIDLRAGIYEGPEEIGVTDPLGGTIHYAFDREIDEWGNLDPEFMFHDYNPVGEFDPVLSGPVALPEGKSVLKLLTVRDNGEVVRTRHEYRVDPYARFQRDGLRFWSRSDMGLSGFEVRHWRNLVTDGFMDWQSTPEDEYSYPYYSVDYDGARVPLTLDWDNSSTRFSIPLWSRFAGDSKGDSVYYGDYRPDRHRHRLFNGYTLFAVVTPFSASPWENIFYGDSDKFFATSAGSVLVSESGSGPTPSSDDVFTPFWKTELLSVSEWDREPSIFIVRHREDGSPDPEWIEVFQADPEAGRVMTDSVPGSVDPQANLRLGDGQYEEFILGSSGSGGSLRYGFRGKVNEVLIFDRELSDSEMRGVQDYLLATYFDIEPEDPYLPAPPVFGTPAGLIDSQFFLSIAPGQPESLPSDWRDELAIHFTLDGSEPTVDSPNFFDTPTNERLISEGDTMVRAIAAYKGAVSEEASVVYRVRSKPIVVSDLFWNGDSVGSGDSVSGALEELFVQIGSDYRIANATVKLLDQTSGTPIWEGVTSRTVGDGFRAFPDLSTPAASVLLTIEITLTDEFGRELLRAVDDIVWDVSVPIDPSWIWPSTLSLGQYEQSLEVVVDSPSSGDLILFVNGEERDQQWTRTGNFYTTVVLLESGLNSLQVVAENAKGRSEPSEVLSVTRVGGPYFRVSNVRIEVEGEKVFLRWDPIYDTRAGLVEVYASTEPFDFGTQGLDPYASVSALEPGVELQGFEEGTALYFSMRVASTEGIFGSPQPFGPYTVSTAGPVVTSLEWLSESGPVDPTRIGAGSYELRVAFDSEVVGSPSLILTDETGQTRTVNLFREGNGFYRATVDLGVGSLSGKLDLTIEGRGANGGLIDPISAGLTESWEVNTTPPLLNNFGLEGPFPIDLSEGEVGRGLIIEPAQPLESARVYLADSGADSVELSPVGDGTFEGILIFSLADWSEMGSATANAEIVVEIVDLFGNSSVLSLQDADWILSNGEDLTPPSPTSFVARPVPNGQIRLEWNRVGAVDGYFLARRLALDEDFVLLETLSPDTVEFVDETPFDGDFEYQLVAFREVDGAPELRSPSVISNSVRSLRVPPSTPTNLAAIAYGSGIKIDWAAETGENSGGYQLYRRAGDSVEWEMIARLTENSYHDKNLNGLEFAYKLQSLDSAGNASPFTEEVFVELTVLPPTQIVAEVTSEEQLLLGWSAPDIPVDAYRVRVGEREVVLGAGVRQFVDNFYDKTLELVYEISSRRNGVWSTPVRIQTYNLSISSDGPTVVPQSTLADNRFRVSSHSSRTVESAYLQLHISDQVFTGGPFNLESGEAKQVIIPSGGVAYHSEARVRLGIEDDTGGWFTVTQIVPLEPAPLGIVSELFSTLDPVSGRNELSLVIANQSSRPISIRTCRDFGFDPSPDLAVDLLNSQGQRVSRMPVLVPTGASISTDVDGVSWWTIAPGSRESISLGRFRVLEGMVDPVFQVVCSSMWNGNADAGWIPLSGFQEQTPALTGFIPFVIDTLIPTETALGEEIVIQSRAVPVVDAFSVVGQRGTIYIGGDGEPVPVGSVVWTGASFESFVYSFERPGTYHLEVRNDFLDIRSQPSIVKVDGVIFTRERFSGSGIHGVPTSIDIEVEGTFDPIRHRARVRSETVLPEGVTIEFGGPVLKTAGRWSIPCQIFTDPIVFGDNDLEGTFGIEVVEDESEVLDETTVNFRKSPTQIALEFGNTVESTAAQPGKFWSREVDLRNVGNAPIPRGLILRLIGYDTNTGEETLPPPWLNVVTDLSQEVLAEEVERTVLLSANLAENEPGRIIPLALVAELDGIRMATWEFDFIVSSADTGAVSIHVTDVYTLTPDPLYNPDSPSPLHPDPLVQGVSNVQVTMEPLQDTAETLTGLTDGYGKFHLAEVPIGTWYLSLTKQGYSPKGFFVNVESGLEFSEKVFLAPKLVSFEWNVTPTTIRDSYRIVTEATFENDVPAGLLVVEPMVLSLPPMCPGDVYQGEIKLSNVGLLRLYDITFKKPTLGNGLYIEMLDEPPTELEAEETVVLRYRVFAGSAYKKDCL